MFSNFDNNQNQQNGNNEPSIKEKVKVWWSQVPLFVRFIIITTLSFYLISWFLGGFTKKLTNIPAQLIYNFQIWRLLTSVFITSSIFNILFGFIAWIPDAIKLENNTSTMKYMCTFFINNSIIQILYIILCLILSLISNSFLLMQSNGLWPLILGEITILCLTNPENQLMFMFLPCLIPAKIYPWALFAFFTVLNMNLHIDILAGILYGYLFHYYLKSKIQLSDEFIIRMENAPLLNKLGNFERFVSLSKINLGIEGNALFNNQSNNFGLRRNINNNFSSPEAPSIPNAPVSTPFQGCGNVLGCIL